MCIGRQSPFEGSRDIGELAIGHEWDVLAFAKGREVSFGEQELGFSVATQKSERPSPT